MWLPKNLPLAARKPAGSCTAMRRSSGWAARLPGFGRAGMIGSWPARRALRAWQKGLQAAGELGMYYEVGRIHLEVARHLPG